MRIAVIGVGGIGGYFGGHLAKAGTDVTFVARGAHLEALRTKGLTVDSASAPIANLPVTATNDPAAVGPVDLVVVAVKLWDTDGAIETARPLMGPGSAIVSFQNGIDAADKLSDAFGAARVLGGVSQISATIAAPGVIAQTGSMARLIVGELGGGAPTARVQAFVDAGKAAGLEVVASPDIRRAIWEKFVFLASLAGVTALLRQPIGPIRDDPDTAALFADAVTEAVAVARASGIGLVEDHAAGVMRFIGTLPAQMKASMAVDLDKGARLELPWLSGAIVCLGRELGVPTPVHRAIWAGLKPYMGAG